MAGHPLVFRFQATPFVILFVERAGSTYLVTSLKSHPGVTALTEKFDAMRQEGKSAADQLEWARGFLTPPLVGRKAAIGFKTKTIDVLDQTGFARLLRERGCKIIQLQRRNSVKAVISTLNARRQWHASGNWNLLSESTRLPAFTVDPQEFELLLRERERLDDELERYVQQIQLPTLKLMYEELLQNESDFVARTLAFLNVRQQNVPAATLKNTRDDLREAILNYDDLRSQYAGTKYQSMFDEVLVPA